MAVTQDPRCEANIWDDPEYYRTCGRPAKYIYKTIGGRDQYLCGIHARQFMGGQHLTPALSQPQQEADVAKVR